MTSLEELWRTVPYIEMEHLCPLIIDRATSALEAHTASLFLRERGTNMLRLTASVGLSDDVHEHVMITIGEGIAGRVAQSGQSALIQNNPAEHPLMQGGVLKVSHRIEVQSAICVPLIAINDGTVLGVLSVSRRVPSEPFTDADKRILSLFATIVSATFGQTLVLDDVRRLANEQAALQRSVARSEQLACIGRLAATVAHEVRNPLGAIKGSAQHLLSVTKDREDCQEFLTIVVEESDSLAKMTTDLLEFSTADPIDRDVFDLRKMLDDEASFLLQDESFRNRVGILRFLDAPCIVCSDRTRVIRGIRNLLRNAAQAAITSCVHHAAPTILIRLQKDHQMVCIVIEDNGPGIPEELRKKVFEPFFTTKARGTGLGLSQVKQDFDLLDICMEIGISQYKGAKITLTFDAGCTETN